jgi:hypothetical protein
MDGTLNPLMGIHKLHTESNYARRLLNMWGMSTIRQSDFAILTAIGFILLQNCAYLCLHGLWRENIRAGNGSQLPKKAHIEERVIGDDLVIDAMYPEYGRLHLTGDEIVLPQIFGRDRIVYAQLPRNDIWPVRGSYNLTGIIARRGHYGRKDRTDIDPFTVGRDNERFSIERRPTAPVCRQPGLYRLR